MCVYKFIHSKKNFPFLSIERKQSLKRKRRKIKCILIEKITLLDDYGLEKKVCDAVAHIILPPQRSDRVICSLKIPEKITCVGSSSFVTVEHFLQVIAMDRSGIKKQTCQIPILIGPLCI